MQGRGHRPDIAPHPHAYGPARSFLSLILQTSCFPSLPFPLCAQKFFLNYRGKNNITIQPPHNNSLVLTIPAAETDFFPHYYDVINWLTLL